MTEEERNQIATMSSRINDVVEVLMGNDASNFTNADLEDLAGVLGNIASVMLDMTRDEPRE